MKMAGCQCLLARNRWVNVSDEISTNLHDRFPKFFLSECHKYGIVYGITSLFGAPAVMAYGSSRVCPYLVPILTLFLHRVYGIIRTATGEYWRCDLHLSTELQLKVREYF